MGSEISTLSSKPRIETTTADRKDTEIRGRLEKGWEENLNVMHIRREKDARLALQPIGAALECDPGAESHGRLGQSALHRRQYVAIRILPIIALTACAGIGSPVTTSTTVSTTSTPTHVTTSTPATTPTSLTTTTSAPPSSSTTTSIATSTTIGDGVLAGMTIVLDPGHNGKNGVHIEEISQLVDIGTGTKPCNTTGTSTAAGYAEARFNWEVAVAARTRLEALGADVVLTRPDNDGWGPCITERADIGNRAGADAVISIHADGGPVDGRGFHVIHPAMVSGLTDDIAEESYRLAQALHAAYQSTGMPIADYIGTSGFSERDDLGGLNLSDVPVVFLEAGNMRNQADAALLTDSKFQEEVADAISTALVEFLNG